MNIELLLSALFCGVAVVVLIFLVAIYYQLVRLNDNQERWRNEK